MSNKSLLFISIKILFCTFKMECHVERKANFRHSLLFILNRGGNNANTDKARRKFVLCAEKLLYRKGQLSGGFNVSKTAISALMTKNVLVAPLS